MPIISATLGQHSPQYTVKKDPSGYKMENPANHLAARFSSEGIGLQRLDTQWGMQLMGWGYDGNVTTPTKVAPRSTANRVEYARENLTESYVNGPLGLEQGFRIAHAPWKENKGQHTLTLSFALKGSWNNSVGTRNQEILLQDENGHPALRYGGLTVHDASGRMLTSWMDVHEQSLHLQVAADGAEFPVTIDPTYSEVAQLSASSAPPNSLLGAALGISDDGSVIVAGACGTGSLGCSTTTNGSAYVFVMPQGGWAAAGATTQPAATLTSGLPAGTGDGFGSAVAISGNGTTIVVSAPQSQCNNEQSCMGEAFVFTATSEAWSAQNQTAVAVLQATDSSLGDFFGTAVAIDKTGSTIVIRQYDVGTSLSHLNLYLEPSGGWAKEPSGEANENAQLQSSDVEVGDNFGVGVSISEDSSTIVAGASAANSFEGEAYVFVAPTAGWKSLPGPLAGPPTTETVKLQSSDNSGSSEFGWWTAVDQKGDTIIVGAPYQNQTNALQAGEAYVFLKPSGANGWATTNPLTETTRLEASGSPAPYDYFGLEVSISSDGSTAAVSSTDTGAYLFSEPSGGWPTSTPPAPTPILNSSSNPINLTPANIVNLGNPGYFGVVSGLTTASTAGTILVSVPGNNSNSGTVFVYGGQIYTISATAGSGQSATAGSAFVTDLQATVLDENGNPVSGVTVTFTAPPDNTATGTFANGTATTQASTASNGVATASAFTANDILGSYAVTATAPGAAAAANFYLTNTAAPVQTTTKIVSVTTSIHGEAVQGGVTLVGTPVTVSFTVQTASGNVTATGNVTVTDGLGDTCSPNPATLTAGSGSCTVTISQLPTSGTVSLVATYTPDTTDAANGLQLSKSTPVTENVAEVAGCGISTPLKLTSDALKDGGATYTFSACLAGNLLGTKAAAEILECPIPRVVCTVPNPPTLQAGTTDVYNVQVYFTLCYGCVARATPRQLPFSKPGKPPFLWFGILLLVFALVLQLARHSRVGPRRQWAAASLLLAAMVFYGVSGCGSSGGQTIPPGTYTVQVTVTVGAYSTTVPVTVIVTP